MNCRRESIEAIRRNTKSTLSPNCGSLYSRTSTSPLATTVGQGKEKHQQDKLEVIIG
jgi:hypothetical protein